MTVFRRILPCLAAVLALAASAAQAQRQPRQLLGSRVRVTAPNITPEKVTGNVTAFDTAQLVVHDSVTGADQAFPLHSIQFLEISQGNTRRGSAGQRAAVLAFTLGGLGAIGGALGHPYKGEVGTSAAIGGGAGVALGALLGALWGTSTPRERWEWSVRPFGYDPRVTAPPPPPAPAAAPAEPAPAPTPPAPPPPPPAAPRG